MSSKTVQVEALLIDLECELRKLMLWREDRPDAAALNSTQPFCLDTLVFNEWLQFVFIEKIRALIKNGQALPVNCAIAPYGEEFFRGQSLDVAGLLGVLTAIDKLFSE